MAFPDDIGVQFVCPKCHTPVARQPDAFVCRDAACRLRYDIVDDIPRFLIDEAEQLSPEQWQQSMAAHAAESDTTDD
ncbi:MAG: Trm112 family protein [Maioricimonas sp. JB049]